MSETAIQQFKSAVGKPIAAGLGEQRGSRAEFTVNLSHKFDDQNLFNVSSPEAKKSLNLLIDTGAQISLINVLSLNGQTLVNTSDTIMLRGLTGHTIETVGTCTITFPSLQISHIFHVTPKEFVFSNRQIAGIIGEDLLVQTQAILNFKSRDITFSNVSNFQKIIIPPRCEYLVQFEVGTDKEMLCNSAEIADGVFVGNSLHQPLNNKILIPIMNTREESVTINNFNPNLEEYQGIINQFCDIRITDETRINTITQLIKIPSELNTEEKSSILEICSRYQDLFQLPNEFLSHTEAIKHEIPLFSDTAPINVRPYRLPQAQKEFIEKQTREMLDKNIIQYSKSPWNFPLLVVPKKGPQKYRLVVDYRKLNDVTVGDAFPLPNITEIFDQLGFCQYFTSLDLATGYHQVLIDPKDRPKTAFSTPTGHYEFNRMSMGLKGAPATFQRMMTHVLTGLQGIHCLIYLDDIIVYGKNLKDHNNKLTEVLQRLREHNLKLQPEKCHFLQKEITYLGHIISGSGVKPDPKKIDCIKNYPRPTNGKELQAFLGLGNYYRRFIEQYSSISYNLTQLLKKNAVFNWSEEVEKSFQKLKEELTGPRVLQFPNFEEEFNLTTDASNFALGAILSQGTIGSDKPIAYASRVLQKAEKNYSTIEKELLAIVWAVKNFRPYLYGRKFTVVTDHKPLVWLFNLKDPSARLMRWRLQLTEYDFSVIHKAGKYNTNADALSRIQIDSSGILESQQYLVTTRSKTNSNPNPTCSSSKSANNPNARSQATQSNSSNDDAIVEITDPNTVIQILKEYHDAPIGGHQGLTRTYKRIRLKYKWHKMLKDIQKYVKNCPSCQVNKSSKINKVPMAISTTSNEPFVKLYLDIVGPLPETENANKYILTMQDDLSKYSIAVPLPTFDAKTVAEALVNEMILIFGSPKYILTDCGTNFLSKLFAEVCQIFKIKKLQTTAYHPQTNGSLERSHRTLKEYLRHYVDANVNNWDRWISKAMFIYNTTPHSTTKFTPFKLLFGREAEIPSAVTSTKPPPYSYDNYAQDLLAKLNEIHKLAKINIDHSKAISKQNYDKNTNQVQFHVGDKVLYKIQKRSALDPLWSGPHNVIKINSPENTTIFINRKKRRVHNNNLKLYNEEKRNS